MNQAARKFAETLPIVTAICVAIGAAETPPAPEIITYGTNSLVWNALLHVSALRVACRDHPDICLQRLEQHLRNQNVEKGFINVFLDGPGIANYALDYSRLSLRHSALQEIAIDDFVSSYYSLFKNHKQADPAAFLRTVIENVKSKNDRLKFGVTIYEDQLSSPFLADSKLPPGTRDEIDYVHLYLHYRTDGAAFEKYVQCAKRIFPRALMIAGAYAFDRIDYIPCAKGGSFCSQQQELNLFATAFEIQADLLKRGVVSGIEFYPANFGQEEQWKLWQDPRNCSPQRKAVCVENTRAMRRRALEILRAERVIQ